MGMGGTQDFLQKPHHPRSSQIRQLTKPEIKVFRTNAQVKSFYRFIDMHNLRTKALIKIKQQLQSKEEVARFEDL